MSSGGIPIQPYWVLGGFIPEGTKGFPKNPYYENSTAVVVNFIVNNYKKSDDTCSEDQVALERAMAWEAVYIDFMKNWTNDKTNTQYMDVAFTSERSIEDELERETYQDVATIAFSYLLMFMYITIALGRITKLRRFMVSPVYE